MKTITKTTTTTLVLLIAFALTANAATYVLTASDVTMSGGEITNYTNYLEKDIEIPETIGGVTITSIGDNAFSANSLTSVTIPNNVTSIGVRAFHDNSLASVTISNSVTSIGEEAFRKNVLTSVIIGNSVTSIGGGAFSANSLTLVTIPNNVTSIGSYAFRDNALTSVTIGNSVTSIGEEAFRDNALTSVIIPNSVTSIGSFAFQSNSLTSVTIGSSVTSIGNYAFYGNALTSVTIPNSVTSIGENAFYDNDLISVTIGNSVTSIGEEAFCENALTSVTIGNSVTSIGYEAFGNNSLTSVIIPNSVTSIAGRAFYNNSLTSVIIPNSVTSIGSLAFYGNSLTSVTIGNSVTSIGSHAFHNNSLTSVIIPNSVTSIGDIAFYGNSLTSVTIGNSVTSIGEHAFGNNSLTSIALPADVTGFENEHWENSSNTTVTSITDFTDSYSVVGDVINSITYNNTGTKNPAANPATYTKESADITLTSPNDSTGYTFDGWFTDAAFANIVSIPAIVTGSTGNKEFYAKWSIKQFTVTFVDHDGTTVLATETVDYSKDATAPADPTRTGYAFTAWDVAFTNATSNLTVTAQYSAVDYSITYNNAGTKNATANPATYTIESVDITLASPNDSTGYTFGGWFTDAAFTNAVSTPAIATGRTGDIAFYAKWRVEQFTVTFVDHDGTKLKTESVEKGNTGTAPTDPTRTGYTFTGWDVNFSNITGDLTVTAQYSKNGVNNYTVTFVDHDGTMLKIETVEDGNAATAPTDPTRTGYTFTGWDADFSNITSDLTVTAQYTQDINGINSHHLNSFSIYPNPTTGHVILTGLDEAEFIAITLLNNTGKVIEKKSFYIQGQYDFEIEGQAGLYYLQITDKNSTSTHKIIKQ